MRKAAAKASQLWLCMSCCSLPYDALDSARGAAMLAPMLQAASLLLTGQFLAASTITDCNAAGASANKLVTLTIWHSWQGIYSSGWSCLKQQQTGFPRRHSCGCAWLPDRKAASLSEQQKLQLKANSAVCVAAASATLMLESSKSNQGCEGNRPLSATPEKPCICCSRPLMPYLLPHKRMQLVSLTLYTVLLLATSV